MPGDSKIEWTDRSWNPVTGCTKVSAGCDHCYAERFAERFRGVAGHPYEQGFDLRLWPERLELPLRWTKPRRIFVNSMSDLFHADVSDAFIAMVFAIMALADRHTFQILTKRPRRMQKLLGDLTFPGRVNMAAQLLRPEVRDHSWPRWPLPNVWLGTSVENRDAAFRIDYLARTPATVRFLSCEPLLGPLVLTPWLFPAQFRTLDAAGRYVAERDPSLVHWVIAGGESGPGFRAVDPQWVRDLRDQCVLARVPFFFKQWGGLRSKAGGRLLDGSTWDQFPEVAAP